MPTVAGGEDIRDAIYSGPLVNPCRVDQETEEEAYTDPAEVADYAVNVRGLDAMEYLLFVPDGTNQCAPNSRINRDGSWAALGDAEVQSRRAAMSVAIATQLATDARALQSAWETFAPEFVNAANGTETYPSLPDALNAVSVAPCSPQTETNDTTLSEPVGLKECDETVCPELLESIWAGRTERNVIANLEGFDLLMFGSEADAEALGFDDLLASVGQPGVAETFRQELDEAMVALDGLNDDMEALLVSNRDQVVGAHDAVKFVVDTLKTEFISVLDLDIPQRAEGDND